MKTHGPITPIFSRLLPVISLIAVLVISDSTVVSATTQVTSSTAFGYSALKLFLEDEQHLTFIRRAQMLVTFAGISDESSKLIDKISDSSETDLDELIKLAAEKPVITFKKFSDNEIAMATFDSLRMTTAKEFIFEADDFEKNILLSQLKVLRVISHLAKHLEEKETSINRKKWLNKLSRRYEAYYQQVNNRISIST